VRAPSREPEAAPRRLAFVELVVDRSLVAHRRGVVTRRDRDGVAGAQYVGRAVGLLDGHLTRHHHTDVDGLAALAAGLGRGVP
jgi:hypothetical protein